MPTDTITTADKLAAVQWARRFIDHPDSRGHRMGVEAFFKTHKLGDYMQALAVLEGELADRLSEEENNGQRPV